ncbi:hypothetical protein ACVWZ4_001195 [Bradyrhizobium sp. USDA 4472]
MTGISTAAPFSIDIDSPSSSPAFARRKRLAPYAVAGSMIFLLGTAPVVSEASQAPSAVRGPIATRNSEVLDERLRYQTPTGFDRGIARLRDFRGYNEDWDGNGAAAPSQTAIDRAISYVAELEPWHPAPLTTLGRDGSAILEFEEDGMFNSITFLPDDNVELYSKADGEPSQFVSGPPNSADVNAFLTTVMNLPTIV